MATYPFCLCFPRISGEDWDPHPIYGNDDIISDKAPLTLKRGNYHCGKFCDHLRGSVMVFCDILTVDKITFKSKET